MPRVSRQQTDNNRIAIEEASSRLFREQGIKGVSVADLMGAAGLTHGGFYGHFESKEALAAVACSHAFAQSVGRWEKRVAGKSTPAEALAGLVDGYLSAKHRSDAGTGCPIVALATDVAREPADKPVRAAYLAGLKDLLDILLGAQDSGDAAIDRSHALAQMSCMVGAMLLARATSGDAISDEFIDSARAQLLHAPVKPTKSVKPRTTRH